MDVFRKTVAALLAASALALAAAPALAAPRSASTWWTNCTQLHNRYKHGLGRANAHDHTKSGTNPVTNFYRSTRLYNYSTSHNSRLDADHDGVACEAH
jgi:ABC-type sugar transport system substrate-binding protein